ncbi:hypothetical protein [Flavobacterium sp. FlaQc-30]|uniref:hypothetical protein n=1 Tax=Flavobacterium sp. FlaQc-30 TaxID=3374179 RepID=UPI003757601A
MTKKLYLLLFTILSCLISISCSKDNGTDSLIEEKLDSMTGKEIIRELLIKNDNDINQLARIFDCSPSSLMRILKGETINTPQAEKEFKNVLNLTLIAKEKTLDEIDPSKQSWIFKSRFFIENHYIWLIIMLCIIFLLVSIELVEINFFSIIAIAFSIAILLAILIYIIDMAFIWFTDPPLLVDKFKNTYDPIWEILK